jgi:phage-related protein (TIGR01555 family)
VSTSPASGALRKLDGVARSVVSSIVDRVDAWQNTVTGLGTFRDKSTAGRFYPDPILDWQELTEMYIGDDMAATIVDIVPDEIWRPGIEIKTTDDSEDDQIEAKFKELGGAMLFREGKRWGRLYGGAAIVVGADDGGNADQPLNENGIKTMLPSHVVDRRWIYPIAYYTDRADPKFGRPSVYQVTAYQANSVITARIHETRLILFGGATTPVDRKINLQGWDYSVLQRPYSILRLFNQTFQSLGILLQDAGQSVYSIKDLWNMIANNQEADLIKRMQMVELGRSVARAIVIDKDRESYERKAMTLAGVPESVQIIMLRLSASARIPATILMAQSPAGQNATGESDIRWFYNRLDGEAETEDKPKVEKFLRLMCLAKDGPTNGQEPEGLSVEWCNRYTPTAKEDAEIKKLQADTDHVYVTDQVLTPEEIADSRFTGDGGTSITIDKEARDLIKNGPDPMDPALMPPGTGGDAPALDIQKTALNGAQSAFLLEAIKAVVAKEIPRDSAVQAVMISIPTLTEAEADKLIGTAGKGFEGAPQDPSPGPFGSPNSPPANSGKNTVEPGKAEGDTKGSQGSVPGTKPVLSPASGTVASPDPGKDPATDPKPGGSKA